MYEIQVLKAAANNDLQSLGQFLSYRTNPNAVALGRYPDINCQENVWGNTPLHMAVLSGHKAAAQVLMHHGANSYILNHRGLDPFQNWDFFFGGGFEQQYQQEQMEAGGQPAPFNPHDDNYYYIS
jgi:ankyrin repeat protein